MQTNNEIEKHFYTAFGLTIKIDDMGRNMYYSVKSKDILDFFLSKRTALLEEIEKELESKKSKHLEGCDSTQEGYCGYCDQDITTLNKGLEVAQTIIRNYIEK